ncbi:RNA-directed DNA polymerase from mobile element jockey [Willisornis vidua]|uniref:RNA-directed DNA polymerase from mobile element jockey n=1 Tax=Willisornis vidua TaxID=1566151 RepID=A0ABQ9DI46_9PASS|nr:RNA-directed DNA polymerase from mobile element jockey [Willisornis vidua]
MGVLVTEDKKTELLNAFFASVFTAEDGSQESQILEVLRELADVVALPLSIIFLKLWRTGGVPDDWGKASVTPIFKKGKKEDPGNYWPISLTFNPGKVMKQGILEVINKHVEEAKCHQEYPAWTHQGEIMLYQSDSLLS